MFIIVGLGNPGEKYKLTRHNVGFLAIDELAKKNSGIWETNKKFKAEICKINGTLLVKPLTYMNNSGQGVQAVLSYYKLLPKTLGIVLKKESDLTSVLTVIHDDLDLNLGVYKKSIDSRSAGHNGVQSIIDYLKTKNFNRIRIGINGEARGQIPADKFVLQKFSDEELKIVNNLIAEIIRGFEI
ncbi:MAG: aminoacyl-tRNA hydrolase [Candidatus Falkowbacteria bacterium]|nr:aminoacyl-tRNA hydrolase [Candidatus Falkowbacteria bacterium]